jgi:RNA polymerase sigma-70 factor (ECF subfamily)
MQKVTQKWELGSADVLKELQLAVLRIHGARDPDLEQEAFLRTLKAFRREDAVRHPRALMWKIVKDTVADHWRVRLRDRWEAFDQSPEEAFGTRLDLDSELDHQRRLEDLRNAVLKLGCDIRGPVYLFYLEGYSIKSIARIYGKSLSAVKMALHRGRGRLERMLGLRGSN